MAINGVRMVSILDKDFSAGIWIKPKCMPSWFVVLYYSRVLGTVDVVMEKNNVEKMLVF